MWKLLKTFIPDKEDNEGHKKLWPEFESILVDFIIPHLAR
jgi:hypothetical protein